MWILLTLISVGCIKTSAKTAMEYIEEVNMRARKNFDMSGNVRLFESDIIVRFPEKISKLPWTKQRAATKLRSHLWPGAVIPFVFSSEILNSDAKEVIKEAMMDWETNTCIRFVERTNEKDYVEFLANQLGCNADVGKRGGRQVVSLGSGCLHRSVIIHEIGHVVGYWHEQNRPDRDDYVHILTENIIHDKKEAFLKFTKYRIDSLRVEYDYHSVMHYPMNAFSKNGLYTIIPKKKGVTSLGNDRLSPLDIKQANLLYKCDRINRGWTKWSRWTHCDKTCGGGTQERTRMCTSLKDGKQQCPGEKLAKRVCSLDKCPDWPTYPKDFSFEHLRVDRDTEAECVLIYERADYQDWSSYSFCNRGKRKVEMRWSDEGPIKGMKCTQISEPKENRENRWYDNYLCLPYSAPYNLTWSYDGKKKNMACIQWYAKAGKDGWNNNYLCAAAHGNFVDMSEYKPIHGKWSSWTSWSVCSRECGHGKQRRIRFCKNPRPQYGGRYCKGKTYEDRQCIKRPCGPLACGGKLEGTKGEFMSPNYPSNYPSDTNCTWIIQGNSKKRILMTITSFDLEKLFDGPCKFDYLEVRDTTYNGKLMGKFCGNKIPMPIVSVGNSLWVSLVTDGQDNRAGFRASWKLMESVPEGCGGLVKGLKGTIHTPNYPVNYPSQKTCIWKIEAPEGHFIKLKFLHFDVEQHPICKYDSVEVKDGWNRTSPVFGRYCGKNPVRTRLTTRTNKASVKFVSDQSTEKKGFKLSWRAFKEKKEVELNDLEMFEEKPKRSCPGGWKYFANNIDGGSCYEVKRNYFNWYGARDDCLHNRADLVSITTKAEQDFVTNDLLQGSYMWLGMNDVTSEGSWAWSDNVTATSFYNWDNGDPNDGGSLKNEDCVLIKPDGKWNDYPCEDLFNYICKRKPLEPWNLGLNNKTPRNR